MQELIATVADKLGLDAGTAEKAVGIMLALVKSNGDRDKVAQLFDAMPGAAELAQSQADNSAGRGGGLLGKLAGGLMGGQLAAVGRLQAAGLDMEQMKVLGHEVLAHAKHSAGEDLVREVTGSIPGLDRYL
jgi:predicted lipid-binding transport protein (Tim44 family)